MNTPFQTANLVQDVIDGVQQALNPTEEDEIEAEEMIHNANTAVDASLQQTVLLQQMMQMMQVMQQQMTAQQPSGLSGSQTIQLKCTKTNKYCWTYGACAHMSAECQ